MQRYWFAAFMILITSTLLADEAQKRTWDFDHETTGQLPKNFSNEVGNWSVVDVGKGKALAQSAKNGNPVFNITLVNDTSAKDVDISVEMKAIAGETDQGGGIVWRAKDAKNYYLARYNPLEDNYRLYKVTDGKRVLLQNADITHGDGAHTLRITMTGDHIKCYYDGKQYLDHKDTTFEGAGKIGLWSKADAQSQFDNLTLSGK